MGDSRRGDFSRLTFDPAKHFSAVLMQQGRVQLDADWNEQVDIIAHRLRTQALDFIGPTGAPAGASGFEIVPRAALRFDGESQYLTLGHAPSELYAAAPALSLDLQIKPRSGGPGGALVCRFDRIADGEPLRYTYLLSARPDGELRFHRAGQGSGELRSEGRLAFGRWSRVTLSHDHRRCQLFIDGRPAGSLDEGFDPRERGSSGALFLVSLAQLEGQPRQQGFDGSCREIRLWNRVWRADERLAGDPDELLGYWRFDRGGDVSLDLSRHANHAVLGGGKDAARPTLELEDLLVSAGRFYAGGLLCEREATTRLASQPDLPQAKLPMDRAAGRTYLFYLDAWERFVSPAEEPDLREPALGGADTAARTRVVAQTRWVPIEGEGSELPEGLREWQRLVRATARTGRLEARRPAASPGRLGNHLYRVEVHGGGTYGWPRRRGRGELALAVERLRPESKSAVVETDRPPGELLQPGDWVELFSAETDDRSAPGLLTRVEGVDSAASSIVLADPVDALAGHREIQLRRIGLLKWSRANGSVALPIRHREEGAASAVVGPAGGDVLPVRQGDWVELLDDPTVLRGAVAPLLRVAGVDDATRAVSFDRPPPRAAGTRAELRPFLRVWDGVAPLALDRWQQLELGIEVRLAGGGYRDGDHWGFAARTATGGIDWPVDASGKPVARIASGIEHRLSPLAVLRFDAWGFELRDSRPVFQPLSTGMVSKAGDRMRGPLEIRPEPGSGGEPAGRDAPALLVSGTAQADTLLGALGSPGAVETFSLADRAVTRSKISPDVGTVPPGYAILGDSPTPPPGYEYTGSAWVVPAPEPRWRSRVRLEIGEEPSELHSAAVGGRLFTFSSSGRTWAFDPGDGTIEERQPMPEPRARFAAATAQGKVYLVGGVDHQGEKVGPTLEYDPDGDAWAWRQAMPTPRCDLGLAVADGSIYAIGGVRDLLFLEVVSGRNEVYDPLVDNWSRRRPMPTARYAVSSAASGRGLFAIGGRRRWFLRWLGQAVSAVNEEYLPGVDRWARRPNPLPAPRSEGAAAVIGDAIFVVGGRSLFGWSSDASSFEPRGDAWEAAAPLAGPVVSPGVAAIGGRLFVHAAGAVPGTLEVQECRIASTFHVHRKRAETEGDLEPQLRISSESGPPPGPPDPSAAGPPPAAGEGE